MGLEGENMWRAGARVRVLLSQPNEIGAMPGEVVTDRTHTAEFWADPDVEWLAGINKASGVTYFNKEGFEELISWLQLPALIEIAREGAGAAKGVSEVEAAVVEDCRVAQVSGYKLDAYLNAWKPEAAKVSGQNEVEELGDPKTVDSASAAATDLEETGLQGERRSK
jgi:hypothetical protein